MYLPVINDMTTIRSEERKRKVEREEKEEQMNGIKRRRYKTREEKKERKKKCKNTQQTGQESERGTMKLNRAGKQRCNAIFNRNKGNIDPPPCLIIFAYFPIVV